MSIEQIIASERDRYVRTYVETRDEMAARKPTTVGELLISINNEAIPYPFRYLRVDLMSKARDGRPQPHEIRIDADPKFEAKGFNFGQFTVEVYPFTWNAITVLFNSSIKNAKQLDGWITRWLDIEDKNPKNQSGTSNAIHSFTQAAHHGEWWYLTADFGTAPADALIEFIELLASQGMTKIVIKGENA